MPSEILSPKLRSDFDRDGYVVIPSFYDYEEDILPIQHGIWRILGILLRKYGVPFKQPDFSGETFDAGYAELIARDRRWGGEVYDAVKQVPAFMRLVSGERNERLFAALRGTESVGIAAGGYGIRIDNPGEEKFRSLWHYEYRDQLRSVDGVVFWTPLVPVPPRRDLAQRAGRRACVQARAVADRPRWRTLHGAPDAVHAGDDASRRHHAAGDDCLQARPR
jgi:hypothetical protein